MNGSSDMIETPWCYMPPEMHFESPQELKDAFWAFALSRIQDNLNDSQMGKFFLPPINKFEKVRNSKGEYLLVPTSIDHSYVFRGQTEFYDKCLPTLYREETITDDEIFLERLRCCEFELYLKQYPQVHAFEQNRFNIDFLGLSQHYGLKTDVIDLTNSLDVALFFAMCKMSSDGKSFLPQQEDKNYIGYIYAVGVLDIACRPNEKVSLFDGKLCAIGLQPFYRPGNQRGFSLHLEKGESLTGLLYSFSYTKQDSENIYEYFNKGNQLWYEDDISVAARAIKHTKRFSYNALNLALKRYYKYPRKEQMLMKQRLVQKGYTFQKHSPWNLDTKKIQDLQKDYISKGGFSGMVDVVQRALMNADGQKKHCIDTAFLHHEAMLKFVYSGCKAPEGYDSPYGFAESEDKQRWGFSQRDIYQRNQTIPNSMTHKVDKWIGDWRSLTIDYNREKALKRTVVRVPRKKY